MKLQTHIAFGLFFGMLFYYLLGFGFEFVLITGFAAFIPDIDWVMQNKWGMGSVHRKLLHNIWVMVAIIIITYVLTTSLLLSFGIIIGFLSHLIADSLTVQGISWLYPYGYKQKLYFSGHFVTGSDKEKIIQIILLIASGFMFVSKGMLIDIFSLEGIISLVVIVAVGYALMQNFSRMIVKAIRNLNI